MTKSGDSNYFGLIFSKHIGEVFLLKAFLFQYTVNPVNDQK